MRSQLKGLSNKKYPNYFLEVPKSEQHSQKIQCQLRDTFILCYLSRCGRIFIAFFDMRSFSKASAGKIILYWRGVRVVDGDALEMRFGESQRGFESPPLR
jgi:hypothetical protein